MKQLITGSPEQLTAWGNQARRLHAIEPLVIIGSVARTAMYAHFGWEDAPTLALDYRHTFAPFDLKPRDFDGVLPYGTGDVSQVQNTGPYPVDMVFHQHVFDHEGGYRIGSSDRNYPVDPAVFEPRTRLVNGVPVRTFPIGTQFCIDGLYTPARAKKYESAWRTLGEFAAEMRAAHPDEFLPDEAYQPFIKFNARNKLPPRRLLDVVV